ADEADQLWRGRAYEGALEVPSILVEHERLEAARVETWQHRAMALLGAGDVDEAVLQLDAVIAASPYNEAAWGLRLVALGRSGRRSEARALHRRLVEVFATDLHLTPSPALQRLSDGLTDGPDGAFGTWYVDELRAALA